MQVAAIPVLGRGYRARISWAVVQWGRLHGLLSAGDRSGRQVTQRFRDLGHRYQCRVNLP
jgi:hypothetical protein